MARRQGAAGRRGAAPELSRLQVVVHDLDDARRALAAAAASGIDIDLRSAPDAAAYAGVGYLAALGEAAGRELIVDCGDDAGLAMAALRTGCRRLVFAGDPETARRLAEMAAQVGAELCHERAPHAAVLDLPSFLAQGTSAR